MDKVLIVDDEIETLKVFTKGLKKYGDQFEVLTASNGEEAVEVLKRESIAVLATDLVMPNMDGLELLAYMTKNHPQVPCIVMTGHGSSEIKKRADRKDLLAYLEKPFDFNELAWSIMEGLDHVDFIFKNFPKKNIRQRINRNLMSLLMEGTRRKDEAIAAGKEHDTSEVVKTEVVNKQERDSSFENIAEEDEMISQALQLAAGHHFQQTQKVLTRLLKKNPQRPGRKPKEIRFLLWKTAPLTGR
jgi:CheY-like chemotaxis protein